MNLLPLLSNCKWQSGKLAIRDFCSVSSAHYLSNQLNKLNFFFALCTSMAFMARARKAKVFADTIISNAYNGTKYKWEKVINERTKMIDGGGKKRKKKKKKLKKKNQF